MSNALAIAAVTSTIRYVLDRSLAVPHPGPVGGAAVTTFRPDRLSNDDVVGTAGVNVFLYQVTPNHAGNLTDLPTRREDGSLVRRPVAALDLHYLLTGYGDDASLDGQRLLGRAITALAATPVLTRDVVAAAADAYDGDADTTFLARSDLAEQRELVKLSPTPLPLEELARLWSVFQQTPYQLSVAYTATVVLLEADVPTRTALPVRVRHIGVQASGPPRLASVTPAPRPDGAPDVVSAGTSLVLRGTALRQSDPALRTTVRVGPVVLEPEPDGSPTELHVVLTDDVPAGLHAVQVQLRSPASGPDGPPERVAATSDAVPLRMHPTVSVAGVSGGAGGTISLGVTPALVAGQRAALRLDRLGPSTAGEVRSLLVDVDPVPRGAPPAPEITIPRAEVPDGRWLVRLEVDGVESVPTFVGDTYDEPSLVLP